MTAYTDATKIAAYLGVTLTAPQITQAGVLAQAASDWIDRYCGQSWQDDGSVSDELHSPVGDRVYLNNRPISAVSAVSTRQRIVGASWTLLGSSQYELLDAANGVLLISGWASPGLDVKVSYTHTATAAPSPVGLAATMIAASWLSPTMAPQTAGVSSIAVGQNDINVKFSEERGDVPAAALSLLAGYRRFVIA
jgi:hypothetical protein